MGAAWRRFRWARRDAARVALWGERRGYQPQPRFPSLVRAIEPATPAPPPGRLPSMARVGVLGPSPRAELLASCARLFGMDAVEFEGQTDLPLVIGEAAAASGVPALDRYVRQGGVLLLAGAGTPPHGLGGPLAAGPAADLQGIAFPAATADLTHAFAGSELAGPLRTATFQPGDGSRCRILAHGTSDGPPVWVEAPLGDGRLLLSALPLPDRRRLADALADPAAPGLLPALMLVKQIAGAAGWHAPALLANVTIDDPALRAGLLGLSYLDLLAAAAEDGTHVTIATIPRELGLAQTSIVELLRGHGHLLSACYHGSEHDGYEFYLPRARRMRHGARPLARQRQALEHAAALGDDFQRGHRYALDRVMVFPHGICPAATLPELSRLGFLATCNQGDRYPLDAAVPDDDALGLRPADTAWAGFPLLWRHELHDSQHALDCLLGRPMLAFTHLAELDPQFHPLRRLGADVRRIAPGPVHWARLEEVARHAYLQRNHPDRGWEVLMTAQEACLHNPGDTPREMRVLRPHLPHDAALEPEVVTIAPGATALVRVVAGGPVLAVPERAGCPLGW